MKEKTRIDVHLVEKGLAPSRTKAQELIRNGLVSVRTKNGERPILQASELDYEGDLLIRQDPLVRYVSRGGVKLESALKQVGLDVRGFRILDVGMSTGGFSDCLLQAGAALSVGIEVGHGQLSPRLLADPRVICLEGVNARHLQGDRRFLDRLPQGGFDLAVIDVSFISLTHVLPPIQAYTRRTLALVKPQFEVGPENLIEGIVKDEKCFEWVEKKIRDLCSQMGKRVDAYFPSSLEGKDGNKEFFVFLD
jgi:23S rRNA (cytidine1920-2'-O)/16S rRNA (cytidine1409-2'-O)-methyltransferase